MEVERIFEGRDLEEAIRAASDALGVPPEAFEYRILEEGRRGLFGLGARQVRIVIGPAEDAGADAPGTPGPAPRPPAGGAAAIDSLGETVGRMIHLSGLDLESRVERTDGAVRVVLSGPDRRILLQKEGELLGALQFLLNRMARRAWPEVDHVVVECEGYRDRREEELVELAREVARQVARTGRPKRLHSMNPYERRLVHMTVREFPELTSHSAGDGFLKQITVAPAGQGDGA